ECVVAELINFKLQEYWEYINDLTMIGTLLNPQSKTKTFIDIKQQQDSEQVPVEDEI
ncbi:11508_t:CDS:2, partial [Dentiscutata heterogama]